MPFLSFRLRNIDWPQKKHGKHKNEEKVDLSSKRDFEVFIWAVQVALRLVNACQL
jgi:hypothetical protein